MQNEDPKTPFPPTPQHISPNTPNPTCISSSKKKPHSCFRRSPGFRRMGPNFVDEIDCGSFFDHIDDLIEFPPENECGNGLVGSGDCKNFPSLWDEALPDTDTLFTGNTSNSASDLSAELSVPALRRL